MISHPNLDIPETVENEPFEKGYEFVSCVGSNKIRRVEGVGLCGAYPFEKELTEIFVHWCDDLHKLSIGHEGLIPCRGILLIKHLKLLKGNFLIVSESSDPMHMSIIQH